MIRTKVCCINSIEEAELAIQQGASALGLVSEMPSGPGVIPETLIKQIARCIPPAVTSVLLSSLTIAEDIIAQHHRCQTNAIQICDRVDHDVYPKLKQAMPGIDIIQVIHVRDESSVDEACRISPLVNALLLDSGNQNLAIKTLGGTGQTHDWSLSQQIVRQTQTPVFLAGGLNADNVQQAIKTVRPYGIDLCSSLRTGQKLDAQKVKQFMLAVKHVEPTV